MKEYGWAAAPRNRAFCLRCGRRIDGWRFLQRVNVAERFQSYRYIHLDCITHHLGVGGLDHSLDQISKWLAEPMAEAERTMLVQLENRLRRDSGAAAIADAA